jgi:hypothetical protein
MATTEVLPDTKISLFDSRSPMGNNSNEKETTLFPVECGKTYYVRAQKPNTLPKNKKITIDKERKNKPRHNFRKRAMQGGCG